MLADELKEIRNLADELYADLEMSRWQRGSETKARLLEYLEEVCSLMDEALQIITEGVEV